MEAANRRPPLRLRLRFFLAKVIFWRLLELRGEALLAGYCWPRRGPSERGEYKCGMEDLAGGLLERRGAVFERRGTMAGEF